MAACAEVTITHSIHKGVVALPYKGALSWCTAVQLPAALPPPPAGSVSDGGGGTGTGAAVADEEGVGESSGGTGVCGTWEELHTAFEGRTFNKLFWPWAGIALHPPSFKGVSATDFISAMGASVFIPLLSPR